MGLDFQSQRVGFDALRMKPGGESSFSR